MGGNGIGFYGPLIDLTTAASHIGDFVQLIVFVHQFHPPQKLRASNGRELLKSTLQVGDDTQLYFDVSLWQKHLDSNISAGDVILLQNVKVTQFRDVIAATTVQHSSVAVLVQASELLSSNGIDETNKRTQIGIAMKKKLKIVIAWAKLTQFTLLRFLDTMREYNKKPCLSHANGMPYKKWLCNEESELRVCSSISEVFRQESCLVSFFGKIGEICLPFNTKEPKTTLSMEDWIFVSKSFLGQTNKILAKDFIRKGCKNCGYPMEEVNNSCTRNERTLPLYCGNSVNQIHSVGWIYRPFLIHVWDQSANIPVLVKNLAAEQLLANIPAESVFQSLEAFRSSTIVKKIEAAASDSNTLSDEEYSQQYTSSKTECKRNDEVTIAQDLYLEDSNASKRVKQVEDNKSSNMVNFSKIILILVRTLLSKDQNSPFKFRVLVNTFKGTSVFELVSFKMLEEA